MTAAAPRGRLLNRVLNVVFVVVMVGALSWGAWLLSTSGSGEDTSNGSSPAAAGGNTPGSPGGQEVPTVGQGRDALVAPVPATYTDELLSQGAEIYAANCQACHGGSGAGNGPWAQVGMDVPPRSFTDRGWMSSQSDGVFFTSILRGVPGTAMPSFEGRLSDEEIWAAVAYIRGFSPRVQLDEQMDPRAPNQRGADLYQANCAGCHGVAGDGDSDAAVALGTPPRALSNSDWLNSKSDHELEGTILQGLPGTAMPAFDEQLTTAQIRDIVDHLRSMAEVPEQLNPQQAGWAEENYRAYCAACHGVDGDGRGVASGRIDPPPRDFRNPRWMAAQTDESLAEVIGEGRPGTAMPPYAALLTEDERLALARYVKAFAGDEAMPGSDSARRYGSGDDAARTTAPTPSG